MNRRVSQCISAEYRKNCLTQNLAACFGENAQNDGSALSARLNIPGAAVRGMITEHFAVDLALTGLIISVNYACRQAERTGWVRAIPHRVAALLRGPEKSRI